MEYQNIDVIFLHPKKFTSLAPTGFKKVLQIETIYKQWDQIASLFVQYLAIYSIKNCPFLCTIVREIRQIPI